MRTTLIQRSEQNRIGAELLKRFNAYKQKNPVTIRQVARMISETNARAVYSFLSMDTATMPADAIKSLDSFLTERGY
jgi:hypothetical protein